jgi:hypothetical protein
MRARLRLNVCEWNLKMESRLRMKVCEGKAESGLRMKVCEARQRRVEFKRLNLN